MPQFRTDRHEIDGKVVDTTQVDITDEVVLLGCHEQLRRAIIVNRAFITGTKPTTAAPQASAAYDQARAVSRQMNLVIRLVLAATGATDLLRDETAD